MRSLFIVAAGVTALSLAGCGNCGEKKATVTAVRETRETNKECGAYVLIPARYETVTEQVCVQQPSTKKQQIEAQYQTVKDTVVDVPGHWVDHNTPAQYKEVSERVLVTPARKEWRKVPCTNVELNSGEQRGDAYCLVEIPPVYENRSKRIVCAEATNRREWIAPVYKCVERRVMVSAAREIEVPIEPKYETKTRQELVSDARWEWRWGTECDPNQKDSAPKATQASPQPPFPVGTPVPSNSTPPANTEANGKY